jgi:uncharacterized membrane protein
MPEASATVTIDLPIDVVFNYVANGENNPKWRPGVTDAKMLANNVNTSIGFATVFSQGMTGPKGKRIAADYQITKYEPNTVLHFDVVAGPVRPQGRYLFETSEKGGTRVRLTLTAKPKGLTLESLMVIVMGSMITKQMQKEVASLQALKRVLEASGAAAAR